MVGALIAAYDALLQALDVIHRQTLTPELYAALPPNLVLEGRGSGVAISLVVLAILVAGIALLGEGGEQRDTLSLTAALHAYSLCLDELHLLNTHERHSHAEAHILVVTTL